MPHLRVKRGCSASGANTAGDEPTFAKAPLLSQIRVLVTRTLSQLGESSREAFGNSSVRRDRCNRNLRSGADRRNGKRGGDSTHYYHHSSLDTRVCRAFAPLIVPTPSASANNIWL